MVARKQSKSRSKNRSKSRRNRQRSKKRIVRIQRKRSLSRLKQQILGFQRRRLSQVDILLEKVENNFYILKTIAQGITAPRLRNDLMDDINSAQASMNLFISHRKPGTETPGTILGYINLLKGTNNKLVEIRNEIRQKTPQNPNIHLLKNFIDISRMT